ncbi:hypothetical protein EBN03_12625 [Nocardia stercoris]|uniref:DUF8020 domain-containing protein n=2 Tax=Nocardia stercoris TaxID=2483361 RepID=A0A3M2L5B1_9NOCA|nr:hypothetical protein EBN03_12625 [Nocardia stercoris]
MTVAAAPAYAETDAQYQAGIVGDSVVTVLDNATFALAPDSQAVTARDNSGRDIFTLPLAFELDGARHPLIQRISDDGRTLALTPDTGLRPIASAMTNQHALSEFVSTMSTGMLTGTVAGFVIGALVGAAIGLGSCIVVGPGCLATTPATVMAFAGGGMLAGTLGFGGAALANGAWKYLSTVQTAPDGRPDTDQNGSQDPVGDRIPNANLRIPPIPLKQLITGSATGSGHH